MSMWSGATFTETSIEEAYFETIRTAQHYVYIENQVINSTLVIQFA